MAPPCRLSDRRILDYAENIDSDHLAVGFVKLLRVNAGGIVDNDRLQQLIGPR